MIEEEFKPIPISDKILVAVDYAAIESRIVSYLNVTADKQKLGSNPWLAGTPSSGTFKSDSVIRTLPLPNVESESDFDRDRRILIRLASTKPFLTGEDQFLAGVVYFLISYQKKIPHRRKKKFYRKMAKLFDVERKKLQSAFERLYPLITVQEKLFPISKWRMPITFKQKKLAKEFRYSFIFTGLKDPSAKVTKDVLDSYMSYRKDRHNPTGGF